MFAEFQYDVFLSHSSKDKAVVRALAERLRADGLKVWFDEWEIKPGDSIPAKIEEGLEHSRVLVLCMSANAFGSDWAQLEAGTFRFRDPLNKDRRFIPLKLDDAPIKGSLAQFLYINWRPTDREQEYAKLLEACRNPSTWLLSSQEGTGSTDKPQPSADSSHSASEGSPPKSVRFRWQSPRLLTILLCAVVAICSAILCHRRWSTTPNQRALGNQKNASRFWLPPALPSGCTNVVLSFGGLTMNTPILIAQILGEKSGTRFLMKDLPPEFTKDLEKIPGYSPRKRYMWIKSESIKYVIGGKTIDFPIAPLVVSNRFYVEVDIPFQGNKRTILLSDEFDLQLADAPKLWDRNYDGNRFEVVNEQTNPVLQVIYKKPNEIQVNGIFIVDSYDLIASFGTLPMLISPQVHVTSNQNTQKVDIKSLSTLFTNILISVDTNTAFGIQIPGQKAMFKYPSWKYPGESAEYGNTR